MGKSKSSRSWLKEHFDDHYVKESQRLGYRSRAVFKLKEIDERDRIIKPGLTVIDLGAAPGGWSQYVAEKMGSNGVIIASDILPMDSLADVTFIQGDFTEEAVFEQILEALEASGGKKADLVISDMSPNMSGMKAVDQPRGMYLVELAVDLAQQVIKPNGILLMKVFQGEGFDQLIRDLRQQYAKVITRKPKASRPRSPEVYLLAKGYKGTS